jgi:hypothetical protein
MSAMTAQSLMVCSSFAESVLAAVWKALRGSIGKKRM